MTTIYLKQSSRVDKKYMVTIDNKTIHFGAAGMSDYTIHKDGKRKANYIARHKTRENWQDITTAGFWSYWILWNKPSLKESIDDLNKKLHNKYKIILSL